jgi:hypothetical protein
MIKVNFTEQLQKTAEFAKKNGINFKKKIRHEKHGVTQQYLHAARHPATSSRIERQ